MKDEAILPADALVRIRSTLVAGPAKPSDAMLEVIAGAYRRLSEQRGGNSGRGLKADLTAMLKAVKNLEERIDAFMPQALVMLAIGGQVLGEHAFTERLKRMSDDLSMVERSLTVALELSKKPMVERTHLELSLSVGLLALAYRRATGLPVTHTANRDGEYVGEPLSPFGRFATAFFKEVDPNLPLHRLANVIRRQMPDLNRPLDDDS